MSSGKDKAESAGPVQRSVRADRTQPSDRALPIRAQGPEQAALSLQRSAGNRSVGTLLSPPPLGGGDPLPDPVREHFETAFHADLGDVRIHRERTGNKAARERGARAFNEGSDIAFARGRWSPETMAGRLLLGHEIAHVLQRRQGTVPATRASVATAEVQAARAATAIEHGRPAGFLGPAPDAPLLEDEETHPSKITDPIASTVKGWGWFLVGPNFSGLPDFQTLKQVLVQYGGIDAKALKASTAKHHVPPNQWQDYWSFHHPTQGVIARAFATESGMSIEHGKFYGVYMFLPDSVGSAMLTRGDDPEGVPSLTEQKGKKSKGGAKPISGLGTGEKKKETKKKPEVTGGDPGGKAAGTPKPKAAPVSPGGTGTGTVSLTPEEKETAEEFVKLLEKLGKDPKTKQTVDPKELLRYYRLIMEAVKNPRFTTEGGESMVKFGRFLEKNKKKIEGILQGDPPGKLTSEKIQKIIDEYGKFIAAEPVGQATKTGELKTLQDYDDEFKYDPGWQKLSKADRKLLIEFAKMAPDEITDSRVNFSRVTTQMKVSMALKLSWKSWPSEIAQAAKDAFTDPTFIITLVVLIGIYVGLWLTPDPSMITKVAAGALTVALLAQFAYEDIYGLAVAWMELNDACAKAKTVAELQAAGDRFAKKVGVVGFDILMFIVMWRVGKRVGPRVQKVGRARATARAKTRLAEAQAKPGVGKTPAAKAEHAGLLAEAKTKAADPTNPTQVLDALAKSDKLSAESKAGLKKFRTEMMKGKDAAARDAKALQALEATSGKGLDVPHFLAEKALTTEARGALRAEAVKRHGELARLELLETQTIKDPQVREQSRQAIIENVKLFLHELGVFKNPKLVEMIRTHKWKDLRAALGEAMAQEMLAAQYSKGSGARVFGNLEVVRKIPEKTVAEYEAARKAQGVAEPDPGKLRYRGGKIWGEVVAEIDALVAEPGGTGKTLNPVEIAEVKSRGTGYSGPKATQQVTEAAAHLDTLRTAPAGEVLLTTKSGTKALGTDLTPQFDFSGTAGIKKTTIGAVGNKGFTMELPYPNDVLIGVAQSIAKKGLPPTKPHPSLPSTSGTDDDKVREEE